MRLFIFLSLLILASPAKSLESIALKDKIRNGFADVDLFEAQINKKDPDAAKLEAFRQSNSGKLVFAIDVNEAANGTEKAQSQGVTVKSAYITITSGGVSTQYSDFSTPTTTLVAESGETNRERYYTLIGETGSSRITPNSDGVADYFDGVLTIIVGDDLSSATSAILTIEFLDTNVSLGDPEAFYDYSNGPEDIAIITQEDASYLTTLAPGEDEAPLVIAQNQINNPVDSWVYYPSSDSYYVVTYEDNYPQRGDYDFNDLVIGYRVGFGMNDTEVVSLVATGYMIARGASYTHDWYLHLPFLSDVDGTATINIFEAGSTNQISGYPKLEDINNTFDIKILSDTKSLMNVPGQQFVNTLAGQAAIQGKKFSVAFDLDERVAFNQVPTPPYDPYIYTEVTGYELHLPGNPTRLNFSTNSGSADIQYKDGSGYPYALVFPDDWVPPLEYVDLGDAYDLFLDYATSSGVQNQTWYLSPKSEKTKTITSAFWKW